MLMCVRPGAFSLILLIGLAIAHLGIFLPINERIIQRLVNTWIKE